MLRTEQKAQTPQKTSQNREKETQSRRARTRSDASLALEAILAGAGWEQLPADAVLALSHTVGNAALLDMYALRDTGPETAAVPSFAVAADTRPAEWGGGELAPAEAPAFVPAGAMAPTAPLNL